MKKTLKILICILAALIIVPFVFLLSLYLSADMGEPTLTINPDNYIVVKKGDTHICNNSYLRYDSCGLWELYIEGSGQERGAVQGALTKELMRYQEDVFVEQIKEKIPSDTYLGFLRNFIVVFNRKLGEFIPLEYREEIAAMSEFCTHDYDAIGTPYERHLNYHAAHDIGHAMQQYMLVSCSSFGVWGSNTKDNTVLVGRNFDFYVGDDFAKNKLVTFAAPDSGYRHVSIAWAGMIGVLSGMNEQGLTLTINAAKGAIPVSAATPISILSREILQYASNIEEAYSIAQSHQTFVSESILISSAKNGKCAIIEKTPEKTALYHPQGESIICTNHFQSEEFTNDSYNIDNIQNSDSKYRYDRLRELIEEHTPIDYKRSIEILRNRFGAKGEDIGIGNEMTLNQSIAHHSVVFIPKDSMIWISTTPWQSGLMVCYDLKGFFSRTSKPQRYPILDVVEDSLFVNKDLPSLLEYRSTIKDIRHAIKENKELSKVKIENFLTLNPNHYYTYRLLGDYFNYREDKTSSLKMYKQSLERSIPYKKERNEIEKIVKQLSK